LFLSYFHHQLQMLVQALYIINIRQYPKDEPQTPFEEYSEATQQVIRECYHKLERLYIHQENDPMEVVTDFFRHISIEYARRELRTGCWQASTLRGRGRKGLTHFALLYYMRKCCAW